MQRILPICFRLSWPWQTSTLEQDRKRGDRSNVIKIGRGRSLIVVLVATVFSTVIHSGTAFGSVCSPPKTAATASLELRLGSVQAVHNRDMAGLRKISSDSQGYVSGTWHRPIGLAASGFSLRYRPEVSYRRAQGVGYCVFLVRARVTAGYEKFTVYINNDYPEGSCEYDAVLAHEMEHVRIDREVLQKYEAKFQKVLRRLLRNKKAIYAQRMVEARSAYYLEFERQLKPVVAKMKAERDRRHAAIDTPENYRKEQAKCDNWGYWKVRAAAKRGKAKQAAADARAKSISAPLQGGNIQGSTGFKVIVAPKGDIETGTSSGPKFISAP